MTKRFFLATALSLVVAVVGGSSMAYGQDRGETKASIGKANVTIEYGKPSLRGRDPLKLIHPGEPWRLGSNSPTTIEADADLNIGGTTVPKGKYILLALQDDAGKWWLIVSSKGSFEYEPSAKLTQAAMELSKAEDSVEQLEIKLAGKEGQGTIEIAWGTLRLTAKFGLAK
jgi:hypothetical protein